MTNKEIIVDLFLCSSHNKKIKKIKNVPLWSKTFIFTNNIFCFFPTTLPQEPDEHEQKLQLPDAQAVLAGYISLIILYENWKT